MNDYDHNPLRIARFDDFRRRLDSGGQLTVTELHDLFHEIEYLHSCREAMVFTLNKLARQVRELSTCEAPS